MVTAFPFAANLIALAIPAMPAPIIEIFGLIFLVSLM
jgi:hypothetical protein